MNRCMHQSNPDVSDVSGGSAGAEGAQLPVVGVDFLRSDKGGCSEHTRKNATNTPEPFISGTFLRDRLCCFQRWAASL